MFNVYTKQMRGYQLTGHKVTKKITARPPVVIFSLVKYRLPFTAFKKISTDEVVQPDETINCNLLPALTFALVFHII